MLISLHVLQQMALQVGHVTQKPPIFINIQCLLAYILYTEQTFMGKCLTCKTKLDSQGGSSPEDNV